MSKAQNPPFLPMPVEAFDRLMPLHVRVDGAGRITGYGPTLAKLISGQDPARPLTDLPGAPDLLAEKALIGRHLFEVFDLRRPSGLVSIADLVLHAGERLRLSLRHALRPVPFRGLAMPLANGAGMILNLSFGIGVVDAVRSFALTDADFAATDLAVEMMYLVEAKTAAMETLKGFALRLQGDKQMAETQAMTDTLTGLRNRRALAQVLERLTRSNVPFGLMHIDLDFFKAVNDTFGHAAGDHVLRWVAEVLNKQIRAEDTVARVGGDEFVAVFPELIEPAPLEVIARRIIETLTQPIPFEGRNCRISASIGITTSVAYPVPEIARMQHDADEALYASKRAGRGRAHFHRAGDGTNDPGPLRGRRKA
jgi:diguanylate cyclase (GGDEF)-like protein